MARISEVRGHYGRLKLYINGSWIDSTSQDVAEVTNPATGANIAELPSATSDEVEMAIAAASESFANWKEVAVRERARLLWDMRGHFDRTAENLARILVQDHGRTIQEARGSVRRCIENIESACSAVYSVQKGQYVDQLATGIDQYQVWEPLGAFLVVTPGNIPMHAISSFVPYALGCGCTVILSPSHQCPVASEAFCKVISEVGFPPGAVNVVYGGRKVNRRILEDPRVKGVAFIGSSLTGRDLHQLSCRLGKRSSINGNGKNHIVIMPDFEDWAEGVQWLARACFGMTGQRCLGTDNVVVIGDHIRYEEVKSRLAEAAASLCLGYGLDEGVSLGPLTTRSGLERVLSWIESGVSAGAKVVLDGRSPKVEGYEGGYFLGPTVLEDVFQDMTIAQEEAFGPVAGLMRAADIEEAIGWINATPGGHSAALFTSSMSTARHFVRSVDVGNVSVNVGIAQPYAFFPLGSRREAFMGMAKSRIESTKLFLDQKLVVQRWA